VLFHEVNLSREAILQAIADALQDDGTLVFLDTSLLLHAYEIGAGARDELIGALEALGGKVFVPLWAGRETWDRSYDEDLGRTPLKSPAAKLENHVKQFVTNVRRFVDEETISQAESTTKAEFQAELEAAQDALIGLTKLAGRHERNPADTSAVLIPFLNARILPSNLSQVLERVAREAAFRFEHKVPPGWSDGGATDHTGKKHNRFGDVIIWFEILAAIAEGKPKHLVIITRDEKPDTLYKPKHLLDGAGRLVPNTSVTLAHPLMVHEAKQAHPDLETMHVVSLDAFERVLSGHMGVSVPKLAAALQSAQDAGARAVVRAPAGPAQPAEAADEPVTFTPEDLNYEPASDTGLDERLLGLSIPDLRVQNSAIANLADLLPGASRAQQIHLGRLLARAAAANAREPSDFLVDVLKDPDAPRALRRHLIVGALAGVYLASTAELRKPASDPTVTDALFDLCKDEALADAYPVVLTRMDAQRKQYLALPDDAPDAIQLELLFARERGDAPSLSGVMFGAQPLMEVGAPGSRRVVGLGEDVTPEQLLDRVAAEFVVPRRLLVTDQNTSRFRLAPTLGFIRWGPGTGVDLR